MDVVQAADVHTPPCLEMKMEADAVHAELFEDAEDGVVRFQNLSFLPAQHAQHGAMQCVGKAVHEAHHRQAYGTAKHRGITSAVLAVPEYKHPRVCRQRDHVHASCCLCAALHARLPLHPVLGQLSDAGAPFEDSRAPALRPSLRSGLPVVAQGENTGPWPASGDVQSRGGSRLRRGGFRGQVSARHL